MNQIPSPNVSVGFPLAYFFGAVALWAAVLFLVPVTITVHGYEMVTTPDEHMRAIQISFFLKGLAMTGAALLITQLGVRR